MSAHLQHNQRFLSDPENPNQANPEFEALLDYLKHTHGCDLTGYKRSSLTRRFQHRMQSLKIETYQRYLEYLQQYSEEYLALLDAVLINVTSFFRDQDSWSYLATEVIPEIIASKPSTEPIRVWSAGCAAGQESCSLLILFAEALGLEACLERVQCFATDADAAVIWQARKAMYQNDDIVNIPQGLLEKYFEPTNQGYVFHPALRRAIIFSRHNLIQDPPISKIDLLVCRNVLIYFNLDAQATILTRLHFALRNTGFLFLGKAEMLINRRPIFVPISFRHHIYTKGARLALDDYLSMSSRFQKAQTADALSMHNYFWETAFETSSFAQLAVDTNGCLLYANAQARRLFGLTFEDCKRPFQVLEPAKLVSSSTLIKALHSHQSLTVLKNITRTTDQGTQHFNIEISRVLTTQNQLLGVTLAFIETQDRHQLLEELASAHSELTQVSQALEDAKSELSMAYDKLESMQKELEILQQEINFSNGQKQYPD